MYSPARYQLEKLTGERLPNGLPPLKRLTGRHLKILVLHLNGMPGGEIAQVMRISPITVSRVLNDPLGREFLSRRFDDVEEDFRGLLKPAIDTLREGMSRNQAMKDRLRAADMVFKRRKDYEAEPLKKTSAEDVVQAIFNKCNVQIIAGDKDD